MQVFEGAFGVWEGGLDGFDGLFGLFGGASCDVDLCVVGVEDLGEFFADAAGGASDDENLGMYQL